MVERPLTLERSGATIHGRRRIISRTPLRWGGHMNLGKLRLLAILGAVMLLGSACGGVVSVGQQLPVSGDSFAQAAVVTCLSTSGHIKVVADSTGEGPPFAFHVTVHDETTGGEMFTALATDYPNGTHFEGTSTDAHGPGCINIVIQGYCIPYSCEGWLGESQAFSYTVSLVP
jgi:hypothetical protein